MKERAMSDEMFLPENLSKDSLKALFESAYMDAQIDSDGDISVREGWRCFVFPAQNGSWIRLASFFRSSETSTELSRLQFANTVNDKLNLMRVSVRQDASFDFDSYIPVSGGVTKRCVVLAVRRFLSLLKDVIAMDTDNVLQ
jgi:hypothetical protein